MDSLSINTETGAGPVEQNETTSGRSLAELEHIVEKGKATFLEVAGALVEIRLRKLYKAKGWTEYLKERFGFSRQHAHRIMQAKALALGHDSVPTFTLVEDGEGLQDPIGAPLCIAKIPLLILARARRRRCISGSFNSLDRGHAKLECCEGERFRANKLS